MRSRAKCWFAPQEFTVAGQLNAHDAARGTIDVMDVLVTLNAGITGHADPDGEAPWSMQIVVHVDKADPPTNTAVCEATATAVVSLLADERCQLEGEWFAEVERWMSGRIRKHARKARGAAWTKVQDLPGVTVEHSGVEVRAFVPCATDAVPRDIAKLQLQGFELDDPSPRHNATAVPDGPVVVSICPDPVLPTGKAAAAAGHAAQLARMTMSATRLAAWEAAGFPVVVEHPEPARWASLRQTAQVEVVDAGLTVVKPQTTTALAYWV